MSYVHGCVILSCYWIKTYFRHICIFSIYPIKFYCQVMGTSNAREHDSLKLKMYTNDACLMIKKFELIFAYLNEHKTFHHKSEFPELALNPIQNL